MTQYNAFEYERFPGTGAKALWQMKERGFMPVSVGDVLQRRLDVQAFDRDLFSLDWSYPLVSTRDGFAYHPDGRVKVVLDAQPFLDISRQNRVRHGALVLEAGVYETLPGREFKKEELARLTEIVLAEEDALKNPILRLLARDDALLKATADALYQRPLYAGEKKGIKVEVRQISGPEYPDPFIIPCRVSRYDKAPLVISGDGSLRVLDCDNFVGVRPMRTANQDTNALLDELIEGRYGLTDIVKADAVSACDILKEMEKEVMLLTKELERQIPLEPYSESILDRFRRKVSSYFFNKEK